MGISIKYDAPGVPGGRYDSGSDMDCHDPPPEGAGGKGGGVQGDWAGGGNMENDRHHHEHLP